MWKSNIRFCFTLEIKEENTDPLSIWVFFSIFRNVSISLAIRRALNIVVVLTPGNASARVESSQAGASSAIAAL